jgi:hypothetical protein
MLPKYKFGGSVDSIDGSDPGIVPPVLSLTVFFIESDKIVIFTTS